MRCGGRIAACITAYIAVGTNYISELIIELLSNRGDELVRA